MKKKNCLKLLWFYFYLVLASISCWATAESFNLTWPSLPLAVCYCIAIGFFLIASLGAIMVANAVKKTKPIQHRGWRLSYGVALLLLFWILTSFPSNTHTFYRHMIANELNEQQQTTDPNLKSSASNELTANNKETLDHAALKAKVDTNKTTRMHDLWHKFSLGSLSGNSLMVFWYCILLALLVDAAAFVFLYMAFKDGNPLPLIKKSFCPTDI